MQPPRAFRDGRLLKEATSDFPTNWNVGFQSPYSIGGGGSETPFLKDGKWKLRVYNSQDQKHYLYDYGTDMFDSEDEQL